MKAVSNEELEGRHALLDVFPDPVVGLDDGRRIVLWNTTAETEYGFTREEALGRLGDELLQTRYELPLCEILEQMADSHGWRGEVRQRACDGSSHLMEARWAACYDGQGRPSGTLSVERSLGVTETAAATASGLEMPVTVPGARGEQRFPPELSPELGGSPAGYAPEILIVDDERGLRSWTERALTAQNYLCATASDAGAARLLMDQGSFDLVLLDVNLPGESGIELLRHLRVDHPRVAVLMVTGDDDLTIASAAIELGAYGYLVKPIRAGELVINVVNVLHRRRREEELRRRVERLQGIGERRMGAVHGAIAAAGLEGAAEAFQGDALRRLVRLAEVRDDETGKHMMRMGRYCELIALRHGLPEARAAQLGLASELHDIGKVMIPDSILLKPGRLTEAEYEVMKTHAAVGHELLADAESELMQLAATVAHAHHERWDGSGYPAGLAGEEIPLEGRIAAVADVFDALTSDRVYRPAFPVGLAVDMMEEQRGRHFDPALLDALLGTFEEIDRVRRIHAD